MSPCLSRVGMPSGRFVPSALGDVVPANRWRGISAGLDACQEVREVRLQVGLVVRAAVLPSIPGASSSRWPTSPRRRWRSLAAVRRIDALFDVERALNGLPEARRLALRQEHAAPLAGELEAWLRCERARLSRHNDVAKAIDYLLKRRAAFTRFLDDGKVLFVEQRRRTSAGPGRPTEDGPASREGCSLAADR